MLITSCPVDWKSIQPCFNTRQTLAHSTWPTLERNDGCWPNDRVLHSRGVRGLQHDCGQQRILNLLNLEERHRTPSAFAIERSRGACSRKRLLLSQALYSVTSSDCRRKRFTNRPWKIY
jgi:hypothetical protein